jgi:hypothetical protein
LPQKRLGVTVDGRIDLIRHLDTGEVAIVDFKSTDRAQAEDVTLGQRWRAFCAKSYCDTGRQTGHRGLAGRRLWIDNGSFEHARLDWASSDG